MYYDDEDDDPYAPRIGPAAMPSPRSKFAPYFSGCTDTLEDFLEEYEGLAYGRALTDPQRVDVIIRYVAPSLRDFWRSLDGFRSRDWPRFRQSLVNIFGNPTPRHQIMRQKLRSYVQDSARKRMYCEDDVLQYYRQFLCYSAPLVHSGHLSEEERDAAFWYGFHHEDRHVLWPRLLSKNPFQSSDIPFHFEDVFICARAAFAYDGSSFWSHVKQFEPPIVRREQPIVEPISRDAYGFRAVTCAIASNAETTTTPDELSPPSYSTPDSDFPHPLILPSESQHTQAPSVTLDLPETAHTFSSTLLPSASPRSHTPSLVHSATDNDLIPAPTFLISTSTLLPSAFPTPAHASSLAHLAADENPETSSTFPSPSIAPAPFSMPTSDFEYLPSATVDQPAPTLSSTPPSSSSISSTFLPSPARLATEDQPEPESASTPPITPSSPILLSDPSFRSPSTDDVPEIASMSYCSSEVPLTSSECLPSAMVDQPEFEPEHASSSSITPTSSLPAPSLALEFTDDIRALSSLPLPEMSTLDSLPVVLSPKSLLPGTLSQSSRSCELESTPASAADIAPLPVSTESPVELYLSSSGELVPFLPASSETPPNAPISPHSTPPQRPPGLKTVGSDSSLLEVTPPLASSVPQQSQELSLVYEASSVLAPRLCLFHSSPSPRLSSTSIHFGFAFALVTAAVLVSTLINVSATLLTHASKLWSKNQDTGNSQNSTPGYKTGDDLAHRLRLGQYTPRALRFVFDPGGRSSSSSVQFRHTKTFASASRRHTSASSPRAAPPFSLPF